jgi:hypothetical protein
MHFDSYTLTDMCPVLLNLYKCCTKVDLRVVGTLPCFNLDGCVWLCLLPILAYSGGR